jgi:O-antigen ligase
LEGLHRTRIALAFLGVMLLGGAVVLTQADKLPMVVQRSLSFLPGRFDYEARYNALASTEWRMDMWKQVLPEVPSALFRGRGWGVDARGFFSTVEIISREDRLASTIYTGNFHNGPLSVLIPFGLYGAIPFVWFLVAGLRVLHRNWKFGSPELRCVNTLLLAAFAARAIVFLVVYGALETDMAIFTGLLGLSVALNGTVAAAAPAKAAASGVALGTEYIKA